MELKRVNQVHILFIGKLTFVANNIQVNMLPAPDIAIITADDLLSSNVQGISYVWYFENNEINEITRIDTELDS